MTRTELLSDGRIRITQGSDRIILTVEDAEDVAKRLVQVARDAKQLQDKKWVGRGVTA